MKEFLWKTQDGEVLTPQQMQTTHLFYVIRMIWNHTAPVHYRLPGGHWDQVEQWPIRVRKEILRTMVAELAKREDLPFVLDVQLAMMRDYCREAFPDLLLTE